MLNRTNRTLSANLNGLNLGTRSLATLAGLNNGASTLRIRHDHDHHVVMRDGMSGSQSAPIFIGEDSMIPPIPSSSSVPPWLESSLVVRPWVDFAAALLPGAGRPCQSRKVQGQTLERPWQQTERSKRNGKAIKALRLPMGYDLGARAARATYAAAAAAHAAAGG